MPDEEIKALLKKNLELAEDNNRLLHSMRRRAFWGGLLKFVWWVFILLVVPGLTYVYLSPYLKGIYDTYQQVQGGVQEAQNIQGNITAHNPISDLIKMYEDYKASHP